MPRHTVDPIVVPFTMTVAKATTIAAPSTQNPGLPSGLLESVEVQIPPGHVGATGLRFTYAGQQILPWSNVPAWINGDNLDVTFPVDFDIDGGLRCVGYNIGNYPHSFFLRFTIRQLPIVTAPPAVRLIDAAKLNKTG